MNTNQIINMIMRTVMRRLINSGVNAGFDAAAKIGKPKAPKQAKPGGETELTPEQQERERIRAIRQARRAARNNSQG
ncbi:hypothetical protein [Falsiruegeria mediterranea]|jgi:hypothetical protein|uniref:Uncharacterized protein n=1 Tax=Falsiruegeria mediterranea M17 TaxID=1200281 RepID=A0A2R8CAZ3_9RHOB|nr:hypothetical protein [Falsiruegeria mediterranea]SPJ29624.1 hypothetical protein TRM7615_03144 [Falsiruegeria mediterranea M17]